MADDNVQPTLEEIQAERARRQRSARLQAAAGGQPVTVEAIRAERERRANQPRPVNPAEDVARSFVSGLQRGVVGAVSMGADARDLVETGAQIGAERGGLSPETSRTLVDVVAPYVQRLVSPTAADAVQGRSAPSSAEANQRALDAEPAAVQEWTGHEPQTTTGEYARTLGEFAPAVTAPGRIMTRLGRVAVPAVASEAAGQLTEGTPYEGPARLGAAIAAGGLNEASIRANANRAQRRLGDPSNAALEAEFGPMTAGERSGNARQRLEEDDLRRGMGSERGQAIIQAFDDRRTPEIRRNVLNIATRGQEPIAEDLGAAGTAVSDALRSRMESMRAEQGRLYREAFDQAESAPVAGTDELAANVDAVISREFLDVPKARNIIGRLQNEIAQGRATYGTVERARQALNRELRSSMSAGDNAQTYAIHRIIDELDAFVAPRLPEGARRAVNDARGFTREMMDTLSERQRTDLATGHVGRSDPGGRAIERVLNQDMTGEQVVDAILGGGSRPSAQTLAAVRRIREINDTISTTNRAAPSGARLPGRRKRGGQTRGERAFAADNPNSRRGVELPNPELQGLREALFYRMLRPMDNRNQGGMIPAQTVVTNLRRALDGPGQEITALMFTEREIAAMRRALAYMERLTPPTGTAVSGTSPAISRMISGAFDYLVGIIPGIGPVLREALFDANSTSAARRAIQAPTQKPPRTRAPADIEQPTRLGPTLAAGAGFGSASNNSAEEDFPRRRLGER